MTASTALQCSNFYDKYGQCNIQQGRIDVTGLGDIDSTSQPYECGSGGYNEYSYGVLLLTGQVYDANSRCFTSSLKLPSSSFTD